MMAVPDPKSSLTPWEAGPVRLAGPTDELQAAGLIAAIEQLNQTLGIRLAHLDDQLAGVLRHLGPAAAAGLAPTADNAAIAVRCLGTFQLDVDHRPVLSWRSGRARALFQYLVNYHDRPIPRDTLIQALWPDPSAEAPATSLKVAIHALRQTLFQIDGEAPLTVVAQGSTYQLTAPCLWIDVEEFERCCAIGRSLEAQGRTADALALYARAAALYRGDFLVELTDDWPTFRREALKDQYLFVLTALARAAVTAGEYQEGIVRCQQLLAEDRCREDTYRLLMLCHARLGQRSRVRSWYDFCVRTLRDELDCDPEPETERLFRLALAGKV
jgi:DNA-binding SARP family transcriptional activator